MGLLTGTIAKKIYNGFKGKLLTGKLRREIPNSVLDEYGDATLPTIEYTTGLEGFVDQYNDYYRAKFNIPLTDVKLSFFSQSAPGLVPGKDDKVQLNNVWYQLRGAKTDPATALWECQSFIIDAPVDPS